LEIILGEAFAIVNYYIISVYEECFAHTENSPLYPKEPNFS
jgi:hypothetical protein